MSDKHDSNLQKNKRLNLKNDIIFKAFFSQKGNEQFLIDLLEAILEIEISSVLVQNEVSLEQFNPREKGGRLDVQAILDNGTIVNIEMQMKDLGNIEYRNDIYESKTISRSFERGKDYEEAKQVISIYILDYNLFGFDEFMEKTIKVLEDHRDYQVRSITKEYYIQLPKFRTANVDMNIKLNQWLAFIDDYDRGKIEMAKEKNDVIKKAEVKIGYFTAEQEAQMLEISRDIWESDRTSELNAAKRKATAEGLQEGLEKGLKKGEKNKQNEIAKKLLEENMDIDFISRVTGLSKPAIKNLQNK